MLNIAIDGPAGAGKSTVAKLLAKHFNIVYLDTGAMYRATAYYALKRGVDVQNEKAVEQLLDDMKMEICYPEGQGQQIIVNGENVTAFLREHHMSKAASDISAHGCVRYKMVDIQREFASQHDLVLDGRDIGSFVLPNANCKIFLVASPEERANRRYKELIETGKSADYVTILTDINQRDYNDSHRKIAPLIKADDAVEVDTTNMTIEEVVGTIVKIVEEKTK